MHPALQINQRATAASAYPSMASSSSSAELSRDQVVMVYNQLQQRVAAINSKVMDLQSDCAEHDLVIKALEPLPTERRCWRLIGDVLVERSVGEALPAVQRNRHNLQDAVNTLTQQREEVAKELAAHMVRRRPQAARTAWRGMAPRIHTLIACCVLCPLQAKYKIRPVRPGEEAADAEADRAWAASKGMGKQGVLAA